MGGLNNYMFVMFITASCCYSQLSQDYVTRVEESGLDLSSPLRCRQRTKDDEVTWWHNDRLIAFGTNILNGDKRYIIEDTYALDRNLMIKNLKPDDEGRYQCKERSGNRSLLEDYLLKLRAQASIPASSDSRVSVSENDVVRLWCNATGLPEPTITWYAVETTDQQEFIRDIGVKGKMLGIYNVSRECSTTFQCQASNKYKETSPVIKNITLDVKFLPDVQIKVRINGGNFLLTNSFSSNRADRVELVCDVLANPLTKITWNRDKITIGQYSIGESSPIKNDKDKNNYLYELPNIQKNSKEPRYWSLSLIFQADGNYTSGEYWCEVTNELGTVRKNIKITQN